MLDTTLFDDGRASAVAFCFSKDKRLAVFQDRVHFVIDNGKPQVKIVLPKDQATISRNILISIDVKDLKGKQKEAGIKAVYIYLDGGLVKKLLKAPFQTAICACLLVPVFTQFG